MISLCARAEVPAIYRLKSASRSHSHEQQISLPQFVLVSHGGVRQGHSLVASKFLSNQLVYSFIIYSYAVQALYLST